MLCPKCQFQNPEEAIICQNCKTVLSVPNSISSPKNDISRLPNKLGLKTWFKQTSPEVWLPIYIGLTVLVFIDKGSAVSGLLAFVILSVFFLALVSLMTIPKWIRNHRLKILAKEFGLNFISGSTSAEISGSVRGEMLSLKDYLIYRSLPGEFGPLPNADAVRFTLLEFKGRKYILQGLFPSPYYPVRKIKVLLAKLQVGDQVLSTLTKYDGTNLAYNRTQLKVFAILCVVTVLIVVGLWLFFTRSQKQ